MNGTLAFLAAAWISAADQPVVERNRLTDDRRPEVQRAADGTSWFAARVVNERPVAKAVWKVSGLGVFDVYHDGRLVGDEILRPGYTHYAKTKAYYTYDLTDRWRRGVGETNDLSAVVSHGWWSDKIVNFAGRKPAFWSELSLAFADGSTKTVSTGDAVWRAGAGGPIAHAAIFDGEEYDARIAAPFRGEGLGRPEPNDEFRGELVPAEGGRVYLREDLVMRAEPFALSAGVTNVVDFGQNAAAVPRFRMRAKPGTRLTVLPAEMLNADGTVYRENLRIPDLGMRAVYTFGPAEGAVSYQPRHTYFGYRYLALTATGDVTFERIESVPVSSVTREMETLRLTTGHDALNRFLQNALWSMRANFLSVPTDCPQRNERLGWTGDAQVFAPTALYLCRAAGFYRKWMRDMRDSVHPNGSFASVAPYGQYGNEDRRIAFADAGVYVPYAVWKMTGDRRIVDENLAAMRRHLDCLDREGYDRSYQWADWLSFEKYESRSKAAFFVDAGGRRTGPRPEALRYWRYLGLCHRSRMWGLLAEMAGDAEARRRSAELRDEARREFFATPAGTIAAPFDDMQTPAVFALKCGLVEGAARRRTLTSLLDNIAAHGMCLQTGFFGTAELLDVLAVCGEYDTAYRLLTQRKCPSWLYQVDQGATTVWERWDSYTKVRGFGPADMNSFNHYAYGSVLAWIVGHAAGIRPDPQSAGFSRFLLAPVPDRRLGRLDCEYDSPVGKIRSSWRYEGDRLVWEYEVPEGAEAIVRRPDGAVTSGMTFRTLADDALVQRDGRASEFSYPALIEARPGRLALTFTFNRRQIAFREFD